MNTTSKIVPLLVVWLAGAMAFAFQSSAQPAEKDFVSVSVPVRTSAPNPCMSGEIVQLSGDLQVVLKKQSAVGRVSYHGYLDAQKLLGKGIPSGIQYAGAGKVKIDTEARSLPADYVFETRFPMISQNPDTNLYALARLRLAVKADGSANVTFESIALECRS